jgi:hypothetical protein
MVAAATARNANHIASGKVSIRRADLATIDFGDRTFDKILAVNVNLFWLKPARELAVIRRLINAQGLFYLFFEPPSPTQAEPIAARLVANLEANGFQMVRKAFTVIGEGRGVCVVAAPA